MATLTAAQVKRGLALGDQLYFGAEAVTPSNTSDLVALARGILVTAAGNVKLTFSDDTTVTLPVNANTVYRFFVKRIWSTGTTATGIFAFY